MRDIKFRAKLSYANDWVYGSLVRDSLTDRYDIRDVARIYYPVSNPTICEYVGLKDRNGKEIYEGDIVDAVFEEDGVIIRNRAQVVFDNGCWVIKWQEFKNTDYLYDDIEWLEVIGNIYDNPELLLEETK